MQATPKKTSTIKLTTTTTTITPKPTSTSIPTTTSDINQHNQHSHLTGVGNTKLIKSSKTNLNKKTTLSTLTADPCATKEIEEISKKISEHADAIYRTWKCRGLAPTELLDIYTNAAAAVVEQHVTNEAADIFGGSVEAAAAVGTTEGLQKLVSQFVIKDKEQQRGVKTGAYAGINLHKSQRTEAQAPTTTTASSLSSSSPSSAVTTATTTKIMPENIGNKMTQKTGIGVGGTQKHSISKTTSAQKPTSTTSAILLKTCNSNENSSVKKLAKSTGITATTTNTKTATSSTTTTTTSSSTTTTPSTTLSSTTLAMKNKHINSIDVNKPTTANKPTSPNTTTTSPTTSTTKRTAVKGSTTPTLDIDINLDLGFDALKLDVNSLSQLQAQNLLKIKELLHENATQETPKKTTTTTTTKSTTKIKRAKSPAKLLESNTVTDSPIVTKTKLMKATTNENVQPTSNNVKKITKNLNNNNNGNKISNSISDKCSSSSSINILNNGNDCVGGEINGAAISKLISTNDNTSALNTQRLTSGKTAATTTTMTAAKTKSNTIATTTTAKSTIAKTTTTTATINDATATLAAIANVVSSVKTVDHQSIKALDSNSNSSSSGGSGSGSSNINSSSSSNNSVSNSISNGSSANKKTQALSDNVAQQQQITTQKSTATATLKKLNAKECKINESDTKINSNSNNNSNSSNNSSTTVVSTAKPRKAANSNSNSSKAATVVVATSTTVKPVMEIAPESNNNNNNNNNNSKINGNNNGSSKNNNNSSSDMPAPTKLNSGRAALGAAQDKLNRPFLTRGSVAERVLMFEKRPGVRNSFLNIKRPDLDVLPRSLSKVSFKLHATPPGNSQQQPEQNSLQKEIRTTRSVYIPRFYFPHGKPQPQIAQERVLRGILSAFDSFPNNQVTKDELPQILKICGLPFYWRMPVVVFCQQNSNGLVERSRFLEFWKQMNIYCHDAASRFVYIHSRGQRFRSYIAPEDLVPLVQDVVDTHPGLAFLKEATEFHSRYVHTVIARIFYSVNRSWSGRITISELKKSDLLEIIKLLEEEDDINQIMAFFSYEHFYVIYCKFWELDKDHDLLINQDDLARHSDHALSTRIVERIFSGCVTRSDNKKNPDDEAKMSYTDFVWFLLSEEDKRTPTAIEYWFRCMDLDGDGLLSMYELEYFYEEQQQRMESIGIETLPFEDCLCQMLDMIKPQQRDAISLGDLKRCRMTHVFFDTFFNLEKYLDHEQRDPFATQRDEYSSDWDRFAAHEYELLISEENG